MAEETAHEKVIDAKLDTIRAEFRGLSKSLDDFTRDIRKMLDDHESRLREQVKVDTAQGKEVAELKVKMAEMAKDLQVVQKALDASSGERVDFWKNLAMEATRIAVFAVFSGGTFAGIIQAFGGI